MAGIDPGSSHSIGQIASGLASDVGDLVKGELALARAEFDHKLHSLIVAAVSIVGGALVAFAGLVVVLEGGAAVLTFWLPAWASLLIVGIVIVAVGGLICRLGLAKVSLKAVTPERSIASVQKDASMIKEHT
ncbi:phage holin family protein [Sphingomonas sp. PsM26]|jgi:hypothetical protein|nr:phage holin family protein [Sphingomonas sp. PsM26]